MAQEQVEQQQASVTAPPGKKDQNRRATTTTTKPHQAPSRVDQLPPWNVLLHNDDVNDIGYVVETILALTTLNPRQALLRTFEAHKSGLALLLTTHREHAELLSEQFASKGLTVTIEAAT